MEDSSSEEKGEDKQELMKPKSQIEEDSSSKNEDNINLQQLQKKNPGTSSEENDDSLEIEKPSCIPKTTPKEVTIGDSSSKEETSNTKMTIINHVQLDTKEDIIENNDFSLSKETENKVAEDNLEENMNKNPRKDSNLKSRKTVATGAEATKLMFERQLAQMYKQQQHLHGKSNMKTTENL